jgi:hypothetical protein
MSGESLAGQARALAGRARDVLGEAQVAGRLDAVLARLDEPLRVAIAGKVKAGKSTLLNALVGQELAPTGAAELTRVVTWYRDGVTYRATLHPIRGEPRQVPFARDGGPVEVDLGGTSPEEVDRVEIEWPSQALRTMTIIDTPGIASLSPELAERTRVFLAPEDEGVTQADAVLYLMRHLHTADVRFLESFHDEDVARANPINAIGVLSRADEIGVARLDAMASARRIAERYRRDPALRRLCLTVVPVAGLLAQSAATLRQDEFEALRALGALPPEEAGRLLLGADLFLSSDGALPVTADERRALLLRFGLFGLRLAAELMRRQPGATAPRLAAELVRRSGLEDLRAVLGQQFTARADVLKARSALLELREVFRGLGDGLPADLAGELERIQAGAHGFAELRLLGELRSGMISLRPDELEEAERLIGAQGATPTSRLGLSADEDPAAVAEAARAALERWRRRAENPLTSPDVAEAARVIARTCEAILQPTEK